MGLPAVSGIRGTALVHVRGAAADVGPGHHGGGDPVQYRHELDPGVRAFRHAGAGTARVRHGDLAVEYVPVRGDGDCAGHGPEVSPLPFVRAMVAAGLAASAHPVA